MRTTNPRRARSDFMLIFLLALLALLTTILLDQSVPALDLRAPAPAAQDQSNPDPVLKPP